MILTDDKHLLFIHPVDPKTEWPVDDELTDFIAYQLAHAEKGTDSHDPKGKFRVGSGWRGIHQCTGCGTNSDNYDYLLPCGLITNSLAVHYIGWHRREVPRSELAKIVKAMYPGKPV